MKGHLLSAILLVGIAGAGCGDVVAQGQNYSALKGNPVACGDSERNRLFETQQGSLTAAERLAWTEIQDRIDRMSHGEEAKDIKAAMHFMADDYTLLTLPDKDSASGKSINKQQIAVYKRQNLDSLYSTSPETHTDIESLSMKGNVATVVVHQYYVRTIRGGDSTPHEARTSVRHRETWIYSNRGWLQKTVQELERGPIFLDGELYKP